MEALNAHLDEMMQMFWPTEPLHAITYPKHFPNNSSKAAFAISFMTDYAATWSQPYLTKIFNGEAVVFSKFIEDFKSSLFNHNHHHRADVALQNLPWTKEKIQLAVVISKIQFTSLQEMLEMALKAGQTIEGIQTTLPRSPLLVPVPHLSTPKQWTSWHSGRIQATKSLMLIGQQQTFSSAWISKLQAEIN
ncbi:uncharacterized protein VP01_6623g1 [Puccinia sorghi]|uniref:Retrotransposon gag domain-containing protein n=1 Tax=Puccinia sorghi TaxID=27349 RepID=A0A0L6UF26_9BASI|nr:uncharacterized protein VP01_6623g1 [Puccinia sorghi]